MSPLTCPRRCFASRSLSSRGLDRSHLWRVCRKKFTGHFQRVSSSYWSCGASCEQSRVTPSQTETHKKNLGGGWKKSCVSMTGCCCSGYSFWGNLHPVDKQVVAIAVTHSEETSTLLINTDMLAEIQRGLLNNPSNDQWWQKHSYWLFIANQSEIYTSVSVKIVDYKILEVFPAAPYCTKSIADKWITCSLTKIHICIQEWSLVWYTWRYNMERDNRYRRYISWQTNIGILSTPWSYLIFIWFITLKGKVGFWYN